MILFSDRGPSRGRYSGSRPPKLKQGGSGRKPPPPSGETKPWWSCGFTIAVPAVCVVFAYLIAAGVVR